MTTNESAVTAEPKPPESRLLTSLSANLIPGACQEPLSPHTEATDGPDHRETTPTPVADRPDKGALHKLSRQTRIIAALGPSTESGDVLRRLLRSGMSVFRIDAANTGREPALRAVYALRSLSTEMRLPVSLLFDAGTVAAHSDEDRGKVRIGLECGADWFAVAADSGIDGPQSLRQYLAELKRTSIGILARLDGRTNPELLGPVLSVADGVLVSSSGPESGTTSRWQAIAEQCQAARKPVVLTTRTETAGDDQARTAEVASVISIQPDAVLLVEETGADRNLLQNLQQLAGLIGAMESTAVDKGRLAISLASDRDEAIAAAVRQADETNAEAILVFTRSGNSAALCAALRPRRARVFAFTPDSRLARRLILHRSMEPQVLTFTDQSNKTIRAAEKLLLERKLLAAGAGIVLVTETLVDDRRVSSVQVRTLAKT